MSQFGTQALRVVGLLITSTAVPNAVLSGQASPNRTVAFVNVTVVPMDTERTVKEQTVIVQSGRITRMGPTARIGVPSDAVRIDGTGKFLMPGLVDLHVHLRDYPDEEMSALLQLYVANGVTTVLNLSGSPRHLALREIARTGTVVSPTIFTSGPFISPTTGSSPSPEEVERAVIEQKRAGYDIIKIHGDFTREAYRRLFVVARREGMRVIGHSPRNLGFEVMSEERQDAVAHAEEYIYDANSSSRHFAEIVPRIPAIANATAVAGTWLVPNLTAYKNIGLQAMDLTAVLNRPEMRYVPPRIARQWGPETNPYMRFRNLPAETFWVRYRVLERLTKGFRDAGVRLLAGTDAMNPSVVPGFSLHDELRELVAAGLTPYEALRAATANAAEFLKADKEFGTVAVGARADLILVDGNPLTDVAVASRRSGVMLRAQWFSLADLQKMLDALVVSYQKP